MVHVPLPGSPDRMTVMLEALWKRGQPQVRERLLLLERAAESLCAGMLSPELRSEAHSTAHKLAGILGTFGFPAGTEIARGLEQDLAAGSMDGNRVAEQVHSLRDVLFPEVQG